MSKSVLIIAGEISGDMHGANLVAELRRKDPDIEVFGIGGERMRAAGVDTLFDVRDMAVMGFVEVVRHYRFFKRVFQEMVDLVRLRRPDLVVLIDYPGFNLRFAKAVRQMKVRVVYYICPQVWAWHRSRIGLMAQLIKRLIVIFPFEKDVFAGTSLRVDFVGHPLVDEIRKELAAPEPNLPWKGPSRVALLPGSRRQEVERILPAMMSAAALLEQRKPGTSFIVAAPSEEIAGLIRRMFPGISGKPWVCEIVVGQTRQVLRQARAAMVASGTATVETALLGCPMIVVYKTAPLTCFFGRMLVKIPHIGMVNVVAGRLVCPEFIQGAATPVALASAIEPLLDDTPERREMLEGLHEVSALLGEGGASARAADLVIQELESVKALQFIAQKSA